MTKNYFKLISIAFLSGMFWMFYVPEAAAQEAPALEPPRIVPPSPAVTALHAPLNYPVSGNNGVPDISIPIYTIEVGKIKVPIVLRYHTANTKIDGSVNCNVAHGWTLETGGAVGRTIRNKPDENAVMYGLQDGQLFDQFGNYGDQQLLSRMYSWTNQANTDTEYDLFNYSFPGDNGSFFLKRTGNSLDSPFEVLFSPGKPYKADSFTYTSAPRILTSFVLRGDNELSYYYGGALNGNKTEMTDVPGSGTNTVSSWMLSKIEERNGNSVSFSYVPVTGTTFYTDNRWYRVYDSPVAYSYAPGKWDQSRNFVENYSAVADAGAEVWSYSTPAQLLPSEIVFPQGKVVFTIANNKISEVTVYDKSNSLFRKVIFNKRAGGIAGNTLLASVSVRDCNQNEVDSYILSYEPSSLGNNASYDYWGYCNGAASGSGPLPDREFTCYEHLDYMRTLLSGNGANRTPSAGHILSDVLSKITYKTGGSTSFDFEPNSYSYNGNTLLANAQPGSGIRIKQITHRDTDESIFNAVRYNYGPGHIPLLPRQPDFDILTFYNIYVNTDISGGYYAYGERVRRYTPKWVPYVAPAGETVSYEWVEEVLLKNGLPDGKIKSFFSLANPVAFSPVCANHLEIKRPLSHTLYHITSSSLTWKQPRLIKKEISDAAGILKQRISYTYSGAGNNVTLLNLGFHKFANYISDNPSSDPGILPDYGAINAWRLSGEFDYLDNPPAPPLLYFYYTHTINRENLTSRITETYLDGNTVREETFYEYGRHYPREIKQLGSDGSYEITRLKYPYDYTLSQNATAYNMAQANFVSPVLEQERIIKNGATETPLDCSSLKYALSGVSTSLYRPSELTYRSGSGSPRVQMRYTNYDSKGNLTQSTDANGIPTSYIWGYNGLYLVAKGENISYTDLSAQVGASSTLPAGVTVPHATVAANCPNARIEFYEYKPLVGLSKHTDPSGKVLTYSYNASGKLKAITDEKGKLHKEYLYSSDNRQQ